METETVKTVKHTEDRFNEIIDAIEMRAMACDGPVTPTLKEATEDELSELWELINEMSPKRKALRRRILKGSESNEDASEYLRQQGLDPDQVGREGSVFVKTVIEKIRLEKQSHDLLQCLKNCLSVKPHKVSVEAMKDMIRAALEKANLLTK